MIASLAIALCAPLAFDARAVGMAPTCMVPGDRIASSVPKLPQCAKCRDHKPEDVQTWNMPGGKRSRGACRSCDNEASKIRMKRR